MIARKVLSRSPIPVRNGYRNVGTNTVQTGIENKRRWEDPLCLFCNSSYFDLFFFDLRARSLTRALRFVFVGLRDRLAG
jgi:hypothetical protein